MIGLRHIFYLISVAIMLITYVDCFYLSGKIWEQVEPVVTELYIEQLFISDPPSFIVISRKRRSGATIVGGLINGVSRPVVTEFTFYLGIPAMFGASPLKGWNLPFGGHSLALGQPLFYWYDGEWPQVSMYAIRFLTDYAKIMISLSLGNTWIVLIPS